MARVQFRPEEHVGVLTPELTDRLRPSASHARYAIVVVFPTRHAKRVRYTVIPYNGNDAGLRFILALAERRVTERWVRLHPEEELDDQSVHFYEDPHEEVPESVAAA